MPRDKFEICSDACLNVGASTITDFSGNSTESEVCGYAYRGLVDNWLSLYPWRHASRQIQLSREVDAPEARWDAAYAQPPNMVHLQAVTVLDVPIPYDRYEDKIYCNATASDVVIADYAYYIDEQYWPPYFATLIEQAMTEKLATALADRLDLKKSFGVSMEQQFRLAKNMDSKQQTTKKLPLVRGRSLSAFRRS